MVKGMLLFLSSLLPALLAASCPPGTVYESLFDKCYKVSSGHASFLQAEKECENLGGNLVYIVNGFENSYIGGLVAASSQSGKFWIGANLLLTSQWSWTVNYSLTYLNWGPGQPTDPSAFQCAALRDVDNYWTKELCNTARPFVCSMAPSVDSTTPESATPPSCPVVCSPTATCSPDYKLFTADCKCYKFDASWRTYSEAVRFCSWDNASLPIVLSPEQNDFLVEITGRNYCEDGGCPWIGLQCPDNRTADCFWVDGRRLSGYSNFNYGQPDGGSTEVFMFLYGDVGKWSTPINPSRAGPSFCQKDSFEDFPMRERRPAPQVGANANTRGRSQ